MRVAALLGLALLTGCERRPAPHAAAMPACPRGVAAQLPAGDYAFTAGWVRLSLPVCPQAGGRPAWLEVQGASAPLAFRPGRRGGVTLGVLHATDGPAGAATASQRFPIPPGSADARELVLAPLEAGAPPVRVRGVRLSER